MTWETWEEINLEVSDDVRQVLEERHITEEDMKKVVRHAENSGEKLYQPDANRYLGRLRMGRSVFNVEYSIEEDRFIVRTAYAHRSEAS